MRLLRYGPKGTERPGILDANGGIRDLSAAVPDISPESLAGGAIERVRRIDPMSLPAVSSDVRIGACVSRVGHFIGVGLNYFDHAAELNSAPPLEPILFSKAPGSLSGPNDDIPLPAGWLKGDWECELALVIGKRAYQITEAAALDHLAGYSICNDVSERALQLEGTGQWMKGKGAPGFGPLGPWLVTTDEIADVQNLAVTLDLNGTRQQNGTTKEMIFGAAFIISYASRFMTLEPGDVITTGTPAGVGHGRKIYLKPGDQLVLRITGLGEQRQTVVAAR
jgi:2-keto-4-pentenoate hydratase/2-oxohepta-3-ene-1,7-dioic acid hydratase in catechol pathway